MGVAILALAVVLAGAGLVMIVIARRASGKRAEAVADGSAGEDAHASHVAASSKAAYGGRATAHANGANGNGNGHDPEANRRELERRIAALEAERDRLDRERREHWDELEQISGLTVAQAKKLLLKQVEDEARHECARRVRAIEEEARRDAERRARSILAVAMQRSGLDRISSGSSSGCRACPRPGPSSYCSRSSRTRRATTQRAGSGRSRRRPSARPSAGCATSCRCACSVSRRGMRRRPPCRSSSCRLMT